MTGQDTARAGPPGRERTDGTTGTGTGGGYENEKEKYGGAGEVSGKRGNGKGEMAKGKKWRREPD